MQVSMFQVSKLIQSYFGVGKHFCVNESPNFGGEGLDGVDFVYLFIYFKVS